MSTSTLHPHFEQVRVCDQIASHIETLIMKGSLRPGERLPSERVLATRLSVSRSSVREALQKLIARGLLRSKRGGGTWVADAFGKSFSDPLTTLLSSYPKTELDLIEYRKCVESTSAYFAALRATEEDKVDITERFNEVLSSSRSKDREAEGLAGMQFHLAIARASQNAVFYHLTSALFELNKCFITNCIYMLEELRLREKLCEQQAAIHQAIMAKDADAAHAASTRHLDFIKDVLTSETSGTAAKVDAVLISA